MGHILRSQALANKLTNHGLNSMGILIGDSNALTYASSISSSKWFAKNIKLAKNVEIAIKAVNSLKPSLVVVDCLINGKDFLRGISGSGIKSIALDYFCINEVMPNVIISLIDQHPDSISGKKPERPGVDYCEGPQYAIIRNEFKKIRHARRIREENSQLRNILITFGGADPSGNSRRALQIISQWTGKYCVDLVVGPLFADRGLLDKNSIKCSMEINIHNSPAGVENFFENADLIFCGGGGTLLEALYVGLPAVVIPQNSNEKRHAASLKAYGGCMMVDENLFISPPSLEDRITVSKNAINIVDGLGAERICDLIAKMVKA